MKMCKNVGETKPQFLIQKVQFIFVVLFESVMTYIWHTKNGTKLVQNLSKIAANVWAKDIADPVSPHFPRTKSMKQLLTAFLTFIHDISSIPCFQQFCLSSPYRSDFAGMGIAGQWGLVCDVRTLSGALYPACCSVQCTLL